MVCHTTLILKATPTSLTLPDPASSTPSHWRTHGGTSGDPRRWAARSSTPHRYSCPAPSSHGGSTNHVLSPLITPWATYNTKKQKLLIKSRFLAYLKNLLDLWRKFVYPKLNFKIFRERYLTISLVLKCITILKMWHSPLFKPTYLGISACPLVPSSGIPGELPLGCLQAGVPSFSCRGPAGAWVPSLQNTAMIISHNNAL